MMISIHKRPCLAAHLQLMALLVCGFGGVTGWCQEVNSRPQTIAIAYKEARSLYVQSIGIQSALINGGDYKAYDSRAGEHPFYVSDDWASGSIYYDGILFEGVSLLYDLEKDKIIFDHPLYDVKIDLIAEKAGYFSIYGHTFVHLESRQQDMKFTGYYDRLYNGATKVYVKRSKNLQQPIQSGVMTNVFDEKNSYYLQLGGTYFRVRSMHELLMSFKGNEKEVKQYAKKNKVRFKSDPDQALVKLAAYYDTVNR